MEIRLQNLQQEFPLFRPPRRRVETKKAWGALRDRTSLRQNKMSLCTTADFPQTGPEIRANSIWSIVPWGRRRGIDINNKNNNNCGGIIFHHHNEGIHSLLLARSFLLVVVIERHNR
jgi:hypothetical protein